MKTNILSSGFLGAGIGAFGSMIGGMAFNHWIGNIFGILAGISLLVAFLLIKSEILSEIAEKTGESK